MPWVSSSLVREFSFIQSFRSAFLRPNAPIVSPEGRADAPSEENGRVQEAHVGKQPAPTRRIRLRHRCLVLGDVDTDLVGHHGGVVRNVILVAHEELQGVRSGAEVTSASV